MCRAIQQGRASERSSPPASGKEERPPSEPTKVYKLLSSPVAEEPAPAPPPSIPGHDPVSTWATTKQAGRQVGCREVR